MYFADASISDRSTYEPGMDFPRARGAGVVVTPNKHRGLDLRLLRLEHHAVV